MLKSICVLALLSLNVLMRAEEALLRVVQTIPLPEVDGRIDHFSADAAGERVFLAALTKGTIEVIDLKAGAVTRTLPDFAKPQGVLYVGKLDKLFVATGKDGAIRTLDGKSLAESHLAHVSLGADAIGYDDRSDEIYTGSGGADANKEQGDITVFNAKTGDRVAALTADAHAGGSVVEQEGRRMFVLVPEKGQVLALDRETHAQLEKWTVPGIQKDVALALDEKNHRLFLGVRTPASVVVLDTASGRVVASVPTVGTLDGLSFDPVSREIFTSGGEGFLDVILQSDPDHYRRIARIATGAGARTSLFVPEWRKLLVAIPRDGAKSAELRVFSVAQ